MIWKQASPARGEIVEMSDLRAFYEYAQAFELAYLSDDWSMIRPFFADDSRHLVTNGGPHERDDRGAAAIVKGFSAAVSGYDHRFDLRIPEIIEGPMTRDDGIWMKFRLTMTKRGLPDLTIEGEHLTRYRDGRIVSIEERILEDGGAVADAYLTEREDMLRPPGSPVGAQSYPERQPDLNVALMKSLVRCYGSAKSEQDVDAALTTCHPNFSCDTVSFGISTRDKSDTAAQFALFFDTFPKYDVSIETMIAERDQVSCWGHQSMTLEGSGLGMPPTGKTAEQAFACLFAFRDNMIVHETYFFDLADTCEQLGISIEDVKETLALLKNVAA